MISIAGYAVVSDNGCIADANGEMPDALKSEAEWRFFQDGLDAADIIVLGRASHDVTPNPKARRRLVMTSSVGTPELRGARTVFWNPESGSLQSALDLFECEISTIAVTGGQGVFDYFLRGPNRYSVFYLSRMAGTILQDGRKVFSACETSDMTAENILSASGLESGTFRELDDMASVTDWKPAKR